MIPRERLFKAKHDPLPVCVECLRCGRRNVVSAAKSLPLTRRPHPSRRPRAAVRPPPPPAADRAHLLLTRYDPARAERGEMLKVEDVLEILSIPLLGIIPESQEVLRASNLGQPVTIGNAASAPARAYADAARRLKGETVTMSVPNDRKSFLSTLFMRRAA